MRDDLLAGRYRKLETIGVGGMAKVYLAEDERLGRRVAIKQLHSDSPEDAAERFEREAKLGASLNHPNLVSIFDIATDGESVLIVMEYVAGETLKAAISGGPMPVDEVIEIMGDVAAALDHAHAHGVVHRDVKPANILLRRRDGTAKLTDLGIATAAEGTRITRSGMVLGTAAYMAPEQLDGRSAGPASDIYSLATVMFEALTGKKARTGNTPVEIAHRVINDPPPDLRDSWPDAPEGAAKALQCAMSQRPGDRPTSARRLVKGLEREFAKAPGIDAAAAAAAVPVEAPPAEAASSEPPPDTASRDALAGSGEAPAPAESRGRPPEPEPKPSAPTATPPASPPRLGGRRPAPIRSEPTRPPAHRSGRKLPSWVPAAAVLVAFCVIAAVVLASAGGGGDEAERADRGGSPAETPASDRKSKKDGAGEGAGAGSAGAAPAVGDSAGQTGNGGSAGGSGSGTQGASQGGSSGSESPSALNDRGFRLMQSGKYDEAIPPLQQAVNAYPEGSKDLTYAFALYNLGRSLRLAGRPKEAVPILERRLKIPNQTATVQRELDAARAAAG